MQISKAHRKLIIRQFINNPTTSLSVLAMRIGQMICVDERDILRYLESVTVSSAFGRMLRNDVFKELENEEDGGEGVRNVQRARERGRRGDDRPDVKPLKIQGPQKSTYSGAQTDTDSSHTNYTHSRIIYHTFNTPYDQSGSYRHFAAKWEDVHPNMHAQDTQQDTFAKRQKTGRRDYSKDYSARDFTGEYGTRVKDARVDMREQKRSVDLSTCERLIIEDVDADLIVDLLVIFNFVFAFYDELKIGESKEIKRCLQGEGKAVKRGRRGKKKTVDVRDKEDGAHTAADHTCDPFSGDFTLQQLILIIKNGFADLLLVLLRLVANERRTERLNNFREMVVRAINTFYPDAEDNPLTNTKRIQWFSKPLTAKNVLLGVNSLFVDMKRVMEVKNVVSLNSKQFGSRVKVLKFLVDVLLEGGAVRGMVSKDRNRQWEKKKSTLKGEIRRIKSEIKMSKGALGSGADEKGNAEGTKGRRSSAAKGDTAVTNNSIEPKNAELANKVAALTEQFGALSKEYHNLEIKCFKNRFNSELGEYDSRQLLYMDRKVIFIRDGVVYCLKRSDVESVMEYVDDDTKGNLRLALMCVV